MDNSEPTIQQATTAREHAKVDEVDRSGHARPSRLTGFFAEGAHEAPGRAEPFQQWYAALRAARKELTVFADSGHRPLFEQPHQFVTFMTDTVLAHTAKAQR